MSGDLSVIRLSASAPSWDRGNLLMLAQERLANGNISNAIPEADVMASLGISEDEINAAEDVEFE